METDTDQPPTVMRGPSRTPPHSSFYPLFKHMHDEHGIVLTDSELDDICHEADKMRVKSIGVSWILVNALRHLDQSEMRTLHEEIGKRMDAPSDSTNPTP